MPFGREVLLGVFNRFCRFPKGAFCRKSPISTGKNGRLKPGKLLKLIGHIGDKKRQFQYHCFDIQAGRFY